jgi:predicted DsbA family dithiol-disulfide isomerase
MKIEIWSDIMCPFCYIGKRHLEQAMKAFPSESFSIEWKSFQLDPTIQPQPGKDVYSYLAERKGLTLEASRSMHDNVAKSATSVGLEYQFDQAIIANSLKAHHLIQLAKSQGLGDEMEEILFKAYFTLGDDLNDLDTLVRLGGQVGFDREQITAALSDDQITAAFHRDIAEAQAIGVQGVPFFVFDRKYAISGAQPVHVFTETIEAVSYTHLRAHETG